MSGTPPTRCSRACSCGGGPEAVRGRDLRRVGRPDEAQAHPGALRARLPQAAARRSSRSSASRARRSTSAQFVAAMKKAVKQFARDPFRQDVWDTARRGDALRRHRVRRRGGRGPGRAGARGDRRRARHGRQPALLPRRAAAGVHGRGDRDRRAAREGGMGAADRREAVRPRPRVGPRAQRPAPPVVQRGRDLPHRPLPRQGDGAEHAGAAVRERHLRADLEPPVHRPRPDHGGRVDRDRGPRRVLRVGRRDPRHLPEPPAAAARADGDGAADRLHRRLGPQREGEGAEVDAHARARSRSSAGSTARASSRGSRCPATARRTASRPAR